MRLRLAFALLALTAALNACEVKGGASVPVPVTAGGTKPTAAATPAPPPTPPPTAAFAAKQDKPHGIALDKDFVYWANNGDMTIMRAPKAGGAPQKLTTVSQNTDNVVVDDQFVYFNSWDGKSLAGSQTGKLWKVAKAGGTATELVPTGMALPSKMAIDATYIYWSDHRAVSRIPKAGGAVTKLNAAYEEAEGITLDDQNIYFLGRKANSLELVKMSKEGGAVTVLVASVNGADITADATNVYYWRWDHDVKKLWKVPKAGGPFVAIGEAIEENRMILVGDSIYGISGSNSALWKSPVSGGAVTTLAKVKHGGFGFVGDETHIYWTDSQDGEVWRIAR